MRPPIVLLAGVLLAGTAALALRPLISDGEHPPSNGAGAAPGSSAAPGATRPPADLSRRPAPLGGAGGGGAGLAEVLERLDSLERRLTALESRAGQEGSQRRSLAGRDAGGDGETLAPELEEQLTSWLGRALEEERSARRSRDLARAEEDLLFEARYQAFELAREHGLEPWQEEEFTTLFARIYRASREIEEQIESRRGDPREIEERWEEFDGWVEQLERETTLRIAPELYQELYGDEDEEDD